MPIAIKTLIVENKNEALLVIITEAFAGKFIDFKSTVEL